MDSRIIGAFSAQRVSPVLMSLKPTTAPISPAPRTGIWFCLLACIWKIREIRSLFSERVFRTYEPASSFPEYTRVKHNLPTKGSVAILNAKAEKGSSYEGFLETSSSVLGFIPVMASMSKGDGKISITISNMA